jgi:hypothetical protein
MEWDYPKKCAGVLPLAGEDNGFLTPNLISAKPPKKENVSITLISFTINGQRLTCPLAGTPKSLHRRQTPPLSSTTSNPSITYTTKIKR